MVMIAALALLGLIGATARAADPGRWADAGISDIPIEYFQGVTSDPSGDLYFDGINVGLYKTDSQLREIASNPNVITPGTTPSYNHVGDISYDPSQGGRILLPLECYNPLASPANYCGRGAIGVADPDTLQMEYYVNLRESDIPKTMWNEVSPDGNLIWTSSGGNLIAYQTSLINPANAVGAPGAVEPPKADIITGGVPPSGITGATFYRGRLYMAGQAGGRNGPMQVWSINVSPSVDRSASLRLEIERPFVGESEGLDTFRSLGGALHWQIQPVAPGQITTYSPANGTLVHFNPTAADIADSDRDGLTDAAALDGAYAGDSCPFAANADQQAAACNAIAPNAADSDHDGVGGIDNCPALANNDQANTDRDGLGDACDPDNDNDGVLDGADNCPFAANADQLASDTDERGDACDLDDDNDRVIDGRDNCRTLANGDQADAERDGTGNACDPDDDNDGLPDAIEARWKTSPTDVDSDDDGLGDGREDRNGDGKLAKNETSPARRDTDKDGLSDGLERGVKARLPGLGSDVDGTTGKRFKPDRNPKTKTNPRRKDTDRDGVKDGREDRNRNGRVDTGETNPRKRDA